MTSLKRSQTERSVASGIQTAVPDGPQKARSDDFYMRRFRSQNGSLGSSAMSPVGPPRSESSHHISATPGVPKMGVRARIADWPPRKENVKEVSRTSQDAETTSIDTVSVKSSPSSQVSMSSINSSDSAMLKSIQNTLKNKTRQAESFFDLLKGYKNERSDHRAHGPSKLSELLLSSGNRGSGFSLDVIDGQREGHRAFKDRDKPLKRRSKSETGDSSIFRKLRNAKGEGELGKSSDIEDSRSDDSIRPWTCPKCFAHYDIQSVLFDLNEVVMNRQNVIKRKNTTTGASAAAAAASLAAGPLSHSSSFNSPTGSTEDLNPKESMDQGDDKSNDLVLSCPYFRNEMGGEAEKKVSLTKSNSGSFSGCENSSFESTMSSHCANAGLAVLEVPKENLVLHIDRAKRYIVEHVDLGSYYFRRYFYQKEHWNYFGSDENLGPVAVSVRREKLEDAKENGPQYNYRVIFRSSELMTLRGSVLEDAIPSTAKHGTARGLPLKEVLEHIVPELNVQCLRLAFNTPKVTEQLLKLDEQGLSYQMKVGIMYCKAGQSTEEEMYNNESAGPAFEEFLQLLGERVRLKGFEKYRAQLDTKTDSTGTHSLYTTYKDYELMFHVSTMLPYTPNNKQQLLRKRHIGNDIVTIVFQEPGALPFSPKNIRSHFQHVFVIVRAHNPCTDSVCYSVAVTRSRDVPGFGPPIPKSFNFPKSSVFRDFLLAKVINAENAAHKSEKFLAMATRTHQEYLKDLVEKNVTNTSIDSSGKFPFISLASKKKEKSKPYPWAELYSNGAIVWNVQVEDFSNALEIECFLCISNDILALIDHETKSVIFNCSSRDVIGWTSNNTTIKIFYERGECVFVRSLNNNTEDIKEIVKRLEIITKGCETNEMTLRRNGLGQLGFHVNYEGIVAEVEPYGYAWQAGLRQGSRLVEICKVAVATLSHEQMIDLLRTSVTVKVVIIPPHEDGIPRRGCTETYRMPTVEYKVNEMISYELKFPFRNNNKWQRNAAKGENAQLRQVPSQLQSPVSSRVSSVKGDGKMQTQERTANIPRSISSDGRPLENKRLSPGSEIYVTVSSVAINRPQPCRNSPSNLSSSSDTGSASGSHRRQKSMPEGFGVGRRSPASLDRQSTQTDTASSGKSTPSWQRSEDGVPEQIEPTCHLPAVSKIHPSYRDSPTGRLIRQDPVLHLSPHKQGQTDSHYSSHSSTNTLSSNASSAHSDEKWYDSGERLDSDMNSYTYIQGTSADSGIDTTLYGTNHVNAASHGNSSTSPRSGPPKEKVAPLWHSVSDVGLITDRTCDRDSHVLDVKRESPVAMDSHSKSQIGSKPLTRENSAYSLSDAASHTRRHQIDCNDMPPTRLRASIRDLQASPKRVSTVQEELKKLIDLDIPISGSENALKTPFPTTPTTRRSLHRTLSDESIYSGQRDMLYVNSRASLLDQALPNDVLFSSTYPSLNKSLSLRRPSYTLGVKTVHGEFSASDTSLTDIHDQRRQAMPDPGLMPLPDAASDLEWSNLVDAAKAFEVQRATFFTGPDEDHRPGSTESLGDQTDSQSASQTNTYFGKESPTTLASKVEQLESMLKMLQYDLKKEREDKANLQAEVQLLREDNMRLQEESQNASAKLKKFTEWVFNTIDMS
uniref:Signal induced proliferation associated 1 like 1 n=1 Tax=Xenopus tropicalis TaxID=8364 RepID=A0A6I8R7S2_XENTR